MIADVDCTAEGKSLCDEQGVQGFPTIKYGASAWERVEIGVRRLGIFDVCVPCTWHQILTMLCIFQRVVFRGMLTG